MMQLVALGEIRNLADGWKLIAKSFDAKEYTPKVEPGAYDKQFERFKSLL